MRRICAIATLLCALAALALPAGALASSDDVIRDCTDDGSFSKQYSHRDYQNARDNLPTDIDEYTDCRAMIDAKLSGGGGSHDSGSGAGAGGSGGGGGTPPSTDPAATT